MRKIAVLVVVCFLLFNTTVSFADSKDPFSVAGDIVLARPLGFVAMVVGGAFFLVCLPFVLPNSQNVKNTADVLVGQSFRFTFKRPLGDFETDVSYVPADESEKKEKE